MLLQTRQSQRLAAYPPSAQPCSYIGQCVAAQAGCRKLADTGFQPRLAAAVSPLECGTTAVTTIGGCGCWYGFSNTPFPPAPIHLGSVVKFQNFSFYFV